MARGARAHRRARDGDGPRALGEPDAPDDPADAHAKRLALLVFTFGDDARKREHLANEPFARSVAGCLAHPARNVRLLAVETLAALSRFDESLVLPHVSSMMRLLLDPVDALAIIHVLRARRFNDAIRAAAVEESVSLRDALAAARTRSASTSAPSRSSSSSAGTPRASTTTPSLSSWSRRSPRHRFTPILSAPRERDPAGARAARGSALCAAALRALSRAPTVITKHHADAVRLWKDRGTGEVARCAERALMLAGEAQDRLRARIEAGAPRSSPEGERDPTGTMSPPPTATGWTPTTTISGRITTVLRWSSPRRWTRTRERRARKAERRRRTRGKEDEGRGNGANAAQGREG